jgi:hypothetical protein
MNNNTTIVSEEDFVDASDNYIGWCTICKKFTRDQTEPDARFYNCDQCGDPHSVVGAEEALISCLIEF